jgi:hypothetical protein
MKRLLFVVLLATCTAFAKSESWKVEIEEEEAFAVSSSMPGLRIPLQADSTTPRVIAWEKAPSGEGKIWILTYGVGPVGTEHAYLEERRAVVSLDSKEVLADLAWKYRAAKGSPKLAQPTWSWKATGLQVKDEAFGRNFEVPLK